MCHVVRGLAPLSLIIVNAVNAGEHASKDKMNDKGAGGWDRC